MKNKNSWDLKPRESLFNKKDRIGIYAEYKENHPEEESKLTFLCFCGKRHSWAELGTKH